MSRHSKAPTLSRFTLSLPRRLSRRELSRHNLQIAYLAGSGQLAAARQVFDRMLSRDVVTWNAIVTAYWQSHDIQEAKRLFEVMPGRNVISWNSMIAGCVANSRPDEAFDYFARMPQRNVASWNAMISGMVKHERFDEAAKLFDRMPKRNVISYTIMVGGLAQNGEIEKARDLFDNMPEKNVVSWAAMISGYVENGNFDKAKILFDQMPEKNVVACTAMVTGYCKEGKVDLARMLFEDIRHKDHIAWNAMMAGYVHNGCNKEALELQIRMLEKGVKPDHSTFMAVFTACSNLALLQRGKLSHALAIKARLKWDISLNNTLINMYGKCGCFGDSESIFEKMRNRDTISWNTIIAACTHHGIYNKVLSLFEKMEANGFIPNAITFISILSACGHAGKVDESLYYFNLMINKYALTPLPEHYACLVGILSRAGQLDRACNYIKEMPCEVQAAVWGALLSACHMHSLIELGELAAEGLVQSDSNNCTAYVMLSNIYASAGMWKEVTRVRGLMKEQNIKKPPGHSWTEISNKVHFFSVGDTSHPDTVKIRSELERIGLHMKMMNIESHDIGH